MNDLVIKCPKCKAEIKVADILAAPAVEKQVALREQEIKEAARKSAGIEINAQTSKLAAALATTKLEAQENSDRLATLTLKLAGAQADQAAALQKARGLAEKERELDLTIERQVAAGLQGIKAKARQEAETELGLKLSD